MARPKDQTQRREQLVEAATQAILRKGTIDLRLADIAAEAGVTPASVLYYYPDTTDLYVSVLEVGTDEYCVRRERAVDEAQTATDKLRACVSHGVPQSQSSLEAVRLLFELSSVVLNSEPAASLSRAFTDRQVAIYRGILNAGARTGEFTLLGSPNDLARSFVALEDGYAYMVLTGGISAADAERWLLEHAERVAGASLGVAGDKSRS
ncbi:TetR/AcrR family transcriptional regulator [Arthrobacter sp. NPDC056886]|uniref:TetR/AcrR family transcriptional regulator n=1 Tax=Arthrobacter sp. NPDC056886 TaxID=3345960 RepID=UPI00366E4EE5